MNIDSIQLKPALQQAVKKAGYTEWTMIQEKCMPLILEGKDVVGKSKTGSGKTAAFSLPVLNRIQPGQLQVLVLTPTRELCSQVAEVFQDFGKAVGVKVVQVYGGVGYEPQVHGIETSEILVGTPGRVLDHIERGTLNLATVKYLILDEADRMFEMGFIEDVERIISEVSSEGQTLLFSATVGQHIYKLAEKHLRDPTTIKGEDKVDHTQLKQAYYVVDRREKFSALSHFLKEKTDGLALVFCATRREVSLVAKNLQNNKLKAMGIHGGMTQSKREHALKSLHDAKIDVLVATDVAARGLDIKDVTHVYNYDVPPTSEEYIHRIGRTARAGEKGDAITLLSERDYDNFNNVLQDATLKIVRGELPKFNKVAFNPFAEKPGGRGRMPQRRRTDRPRFGSFRR